MKSSVIFSSYGDPSDDWSFKNLKKLLSPAGVTFEVKRREEGNHYDICIEYDYMQLHKYMTRWAGPNRKHVRGVIYREEIEERLKTETAEEIAESLGISRSTLFRRLKDAREYEKETLDF